MNWETGQLLQAEFGYNSQRTECRDTAGRLRNERGVSESTKRKKRKHCGRKCCVNIDDMGMGQYL